MLKFIKLFLLVTLLILSRPAVSQTSTKKIAPANVKTMYGESFNTSNLDNNSKPMIIVIWRTDRRSCFQYFQALNEDLSDWQKETGVKVVAVSIDPPKSAPDVLPMVKARQWDFESYIDTYQEFKTAMGVVGVPYTFIVNGKGEVVWEKQAYSPGLETEIYEIIKKVAKGEKVD
jgi:cytochrome c biogenesis protein CcmG/thiol:disulfide interchange protein DsbE